MTVRGGYGQPTVPVTDDVPDECPKFAALCDGYADPMTIAYGASDVISDAIEAHVRKCSHPFCVAERMP